MDANNVFEPRGLMGAEGWRFDLARAQFIFGGKGKSSQVFQMSDTEGVHSGHVKLVPVEGGAGINVG